MPRKARIDAPGALHHIIVRGIERSRIFDDDQDRYAFLERLGQVLTETKTDCYAWALIPNHFHLLLRTGTAPVATVMLRLLTGYAISYNHRHRRHGHLFQNRYKSILCQEEPYMLELVRYIHLNPLRARLVPDLEQLDNFPFSGNAVIMGKQRHPWQNSNKVLGLFGKTIASARRAYRKFVAKGLEQGRRADLIGGGLIRSSGGWATVRQMRKAKVHVKSDERILGDGDFVTQVLSEANDHFERKHALKARGVNVDIIAEKVAALLKMAPEEVWQPGKYQRLVTARSLICFWAVSELGERLISLAARFNVSAAGVSKSVKRGREIAREKGYSFSKLIS